MGFLCKLVAVPLFMLRTISSIAEPRDVKDSQVLIIQLKSLKGEVVALNGASAFHSFIQKQPL
jgi:hypothetical protein